MPIPASSLARRVAAGRLDQQAERRATDHRTGDDQHAEHDHDRRRHAEHGAVAEPDQVGRGEGDDAALGDELRDAPARHHQDQGGDDRLDAEHRNKKPVPEPAEQSGAKRCGERQRQAVGIGKAAAMAPDIAITAPTDRSMPRVAMTSTMPSASSATGAPRFRTSIRLPNSRPSCIRRSKNCGETARSTARITSKAMIWARPRLCSSLCAAQQSWHHGCPASAPAVPATAIAARILETSMASPSSSSTWARSRSTITRSE